MSDLRDLYQEVILDHTRNPRNFGKLDSANREADGYNPICGDKIRVYVEVQDGEVRDVRFDGSGCAISTASASLMTESIKGKSQAEAEAMFHRFHELLTAAPEVEVNTSGLGKLSVMGGVREYPMRVKCATLAWHTLHAALDGGDREVTTE
jgi:nitrogen fixation NifU-like protein